MPYPREQKKTLHSNPRRQFGRMTRSTSLRTTARARATGGATRHSATKLSPLLRLRMRMNISRRVVMKQQGPTSTFILHTEHHSDDDDDNKDLSDSFKNNGSKPTRVQKIEDALALRIGRTTGDPLLNNLTEGPPVLVLCSGIGSKEVDGHDDRLRNGILG